MRRVPQLHLHDEMAARLIGAGQVEVPLRLSSVSASKAFFSNCTSRIGTADLISACKAVRRNKVLPSLPNVALKP